MANGYVRYGNSIHLDGFQILDFCIENAISLESLSDKNLGRKVFLTGNDTNPGYLRENVWDGSTWRAAAYLDDIDRITNGEGSLGTRVKALEDMLNVDSAETVVSTWEEIQAFLDNVKEGTDLMTMLDGKLDKTGGTISNDKWANQLILNHNTSGEPAGLRFHSNDELMGIIYVNYQHRLMFHNGTIPSLEVLHSGNVGDYAVLADVYNENGVSPAMNTVGLLNGVGAYAKFGYGSYWFEFYSTDSELHFINHRGSSSEIDKTIAFTDSDITGNAATATALKNKVSLWGNEFDGTQSMNGNIHMPNGSALNFITTTQEYIAAVNMASDNVLTFGNGTNFSTRTLNTRVDGYNIYFRTGAKQTAMTITKEGNVNIGTAFEGFKFSVYGGMTFLHGVESSALVLGQMPTNGLLVGNTNYGIGQWFQGGQGHIQASSFGNTTATAYALNLNPLGGAVNIGSADGAINVLGNLTTSGDITLGKTTVANTIQSEGPIQILANSRYLYLRAKGGIDIVSGGNGQDSYGITFANAALAPFAANNNTISLGTSSYRWSDVYSVGGNFSGRVLIGGAVDDENYKLNVYGDALFGVENQIALRNCNISLLINPSITGGWSKGLYISKNGVTLSGFGFYGNNNTLRYAYIGSMPSPWFTINSTESNFNVLTKFNGGALIPTGQKLTFGDGGPTMEYDATNNAIKVTGSLYTTGILASGGKGKEGTGTGSGSANVRDFEFLADGKTTYYCDHMLKTKNVIVQVFEKVIQNSIEVWDMIVADVTIVTEDRVTVTFGRPTTKVHKVHIIGGNVS